MPIYEYTCTKCDHAFEKLVFSSDNAKVACPKCGSGQAKRLLSPISFISMSNSDMCSAGDTCSAGNACSAGAGPPKGFS